jgi:hypothetical protein
LCSMAESSTSGQIEPIADLLGTVRDGARMVLAKICRVTDSESGAKSRQFCSNTG